MILALMLQMVTGLTANGQAPRAADSGPAVRISINSDGRFQRGDRAQVKVKVSEDGYLLVVRATTEGRVRILTPLDPGADNFVRGGKTYEILGRGDRDAFTVDDPTGSGTILAAISPDPFRFAEFTRGDHWDYRVLADVSVGGDPEGTLVDLVQRMSPGGHFRYDMVSYVVETVTAYDGGYGYGGYMGYQWPGWGSCYYSCYGSGFSFGISIGAPYYYQPWYADPWYYYPYYPIYATPYYPIYGYPGYGYPIYRYPGYGYPHHGYLPSYRQPYAFKPVSPTYLNPGGTAAGSYSFRRPSMDPGTHLGTFTDYRPRSVTPGATTVGETHFMPRARSGQPGRTDPRGLRSTPPNNEPSAGRRTAPPAPWTGVSQTGRPVSPRETAPAREVRPRAEPQAPSGNRSGGQAPEARRPESSQWSQPRAEPRRMEPAQRPAPQPHFSPSPQPRSYSPPSAPPAARSGGGGEGRGGGARRRP
jgi:hypothetical protein